MTARPFTSDRERRLWLALFAVVAAIYGTLTFTRPLSEALREAGLLEAVFVAGMALVIAAVIAQALRIRPRGAELAVWIGVVAAYLMVLVRIEIPEERTHLIEYGVVAMLILELLRERSSNGRRVPVPALLAVASTALIGAVDEGIQAVLPDRVFDPRDLMFNALAGLMAVLASMSLGWVRGLRETARSPADT